LINAVRQCDPTIILRAADRCDGHNIMSPQAFVDAGLPQEVVAHLTRTYKSDGTPKGTLFVNGQAVGELRGVYGLDLLKFLAAALGVEYPSAFGRGRQARHIQAALREHFQTQQPKGA
jgi:acyl CoA:acetate/3-ketoacid CoA transferase